MKSAATRTLEVSLAVCLAAATMWGQPTSDVSAFIRQGIAFRQQDQPAKAIDCFRQAMRTDPQSLRAHAEYVRTKTYGLDSFDDVKAEYEALMQKEPGNPVYPMALAVGQHITPGSGKNQWYARVARAAPDSASGLFAQAELGYDRDPAAAADKCVRATQLDPSLGDAYTFGIFLRESKLHDLDGALELAGNLSNQSDPGLRANGLYQLWRLRLLKSQDSAETVAQLRKDLQQLTSSEREIDVLTTVRSAYSQLLKDTAGVQDVEAAIRKIDAAWYPERGSEMYFSFTNESFRPRQIALVNRQVQVVNTILDMDPELPAKERLASADALLAKINAPGAGMLAYRHLFRAAEQASDLAVMIEAGEKYQDASMRFDHEVIDAGLLAKIALARADLSSDLPRAVQYAQRACDATASLQPWKTPRNTDEHWLGHADEKERQRAYQATRALALEARGWTLCASGHCAEGEPLIRQAVELQRSEKNLRHLAGALQKLDRLAEAAEVSAQAQSEWLESLKRRLRKDPSKDFEVPAVDGQPIRLSSLKGNVVLVNFWATWCSPCVQEMPLLNELYGKYRGKGLEILAISVDDENARYKVPAFVKDQGLTFPVAYDAGAKDLYKVSSYPTSMLIDRDGMVRLRFNIAEKRSLDAMLAELLK